MSSNGIKDLLLEVHTESSVTFTLEGNQRLESIQCLDYSFEADRSRLHIVFAGGQGDDRADQILRHDQQPIAVLCGQEAGEVQFDFLLSR